MLINQKRGPATTFPGILQVTGPAGQGISSILPTKRGTDVVSSLTDLGVLHSAAEALESCCYALGTSVAPRVYSREGTYGYP